MENTKTKKERLDYFAALAMQSLIAKIDKNICIDKKQIEPLCFTAIEFAKEIIKQIDNEQI
jgi:hypothetical protein